MTDAIDNLIAYAATCRRRNTPEWMKELAERLNAAIIARGCDSRVVWQAWASEFELEVGGEVVQTIWGAVPVGDGA